MINDYVDSLSPLGYDLMTVVFHRCLTRGYQIYRNYNIFNVLLVRKQRQSDEIEVVLVKFQDP